MSNCRKFIVKCINVDGIESDLEYGELYDGIVYANEEVIYIDQRAFFLERFKVMMIMDLPDETIIEKHVPPNTHGVKHDQGKRDISLIPVDALLKVTEVFDFGKNKYGSHNWRKGFAWTRLSSAILRHTLAWIKGEDADPESGLPHLAHAAASVLMLLELTLKNIGSDDRHKYENNR
jgi:hypothetical protein